MCGLVGFMGTQTKSTYNMFRTLLFLDVMRGPHSTGVGIYHRPFMKSKPDETLVFKDATPSWDFLRYNAFNKYMDTNTFETSLMMGHNRFKTIGEVKDENAHPFKHGHLIGAQNGTLDNFHSREGKEFFEVDSDWAIWRMSELGVAAAIKEMSGAWAFSVFDINDKKLYLTRNKERPLYFALTDDKKGLFWASQKNMLEFAASEHGIKFDNSNKDCPLGLWTLNPEDMAIFTLPERFKEFEWCEVVQAKGAPKHTSPFVQSGGPWQEWGSELSKRSMQERLQLPAPKTPEKSKPGEKKENVVDLQSVRESVKAVFGTPSTTTRSQEMPGKVLPEAEWQEIIADGCACCGHPVRKDRPHKIVDNGRQALCHFCTPLEEKNPYWGLQPKMFEKNDLVVWPELTKELYEKRILEIFDQPAEKRSIH